MSRAPWLLLVGLVIFSVFTQLELFQANRRIEALEHDVVGFYRLLYKPLPKEAVP